MNSPADDRRVRKTKKALRQGLVSLLEKKNLKDVTVRELTDAVDLHRGTFYVHYRDIYELYDKMWQEAIEEIREIFRQYPPEELSGGPMPLFRAIMEYAWENRDLCQMFFGPNGYLSIYAVGGCMGILRRWVDTGMQESPGEMALLLNQITNAAVTAGSSK